MSEDQAIDLEKWREEKERAGGERREKTVAESQEDRQTLLKGLESVFEEAKGRGVDPEALRLLQAILVAWQEVFSRNTTILADGMYEYYSLVIDELNELVRAQNINVLSFKEYTERTSADLDWVVDEVEALKAQVVELATPKKQAVMSTELETFKARVAELEAERVQREEEARERRAATVDRFSNMWQSALASGVGCAAIVGLLTHSVTWGIAGLALGIGFGLYAEKRRLGPLHAKP